MGEKLAISKDIRTREQAEGVLGILSQLLIRSYKEAAYLALFPAKSRRKRMSDMDVFEFTLAGVRAESRSVQGRDCNPPGNRRFFIKHVSTYFAWAWTLADSDISRGHLESQYFCVEAKRAIKAFEQLSRSPFITAQRFLCVLYYRFCQQVPSRVRPDLPYRHVAPSLKPFAAKRHKNTEELKQELIKKHNREIRDRPAVVNRASMGKRVRFRLPLSPPPVASPKRREAV